MKSNEGQSYTSIFNSAPINVRSGYRTHQEIICRHISEVIKILLVSESGLQCPIKFFFKKKVLYMSILFLTAVQERSTVNLFQSEC